MTSGEIALRNNRYNYYYYYRSQDMGTLYDSQLIRSVPTDDISGRWSFMSE